MPPVEAWHLRARTVQAMVLLGAARLAVLLLPFAYWRVTVGQLAPQDSVGPAAEWTIGSGGAARRLAAHVERGAERLPFTTKCLPRAVALCWLLRATGIGYVLKIAARPAAVRNATPMANDDTLHAWVESGGCTVLGALPGPWLVVLALRG